MLAEKLQRGVRRMFAHPFQDVAPDHQKAGSGITRAGKSVDHDDTIRIVDFEHIVERG